MARLVMTCVPLIPSMIYADSVEATATSPRNSGDILNRNVLHFSNVIHF